mgnify:CR=1 FL=1
MHPPPHHNSIQRRQLATSKVNFLLTVNFMACFLPSSVNKLSGCSFKAGEIGKT